VNSYDKLREACVDTWPCLGCCDEDRYSAWKGNRAYWEGWAEGRLDELARVPARIREHFPYAEESIKRFAERMHGGWGVGFDLDVCLGDFYQQNGIITAIDACGICLRQDCSDSDVASDQFRCSAPGSVECRAVGEAVSDIRQSLNVADAQLTAIRNSLTKAGVPEFETTDGGGHSLSSVERIERLAAEAADGRRLRKLFDDAGEGEHNVLALLDHYMDREHLAYNREAKARDVVAAARELCSYNWLIEMHPCETSALCDMLASYDKKDSGELRGE
jgi:hypothetical protein